MTLTPHIPADSPEFPGDSSPQPPFGLRDSLQSVAVWAGGAAQLAMWASVIRLMAGRIDFRKVDRLLKLMARSMTVFSGVRVDVRGLDKLDTDRAYVFVSNHINIFDMFVLYQAIPQFTRALEHVDHFSWPLIGTLISAAGQIPVDPSNRRVTVRGLKQAAEMLAAGDSITILPEGARTLDGSVGPFFPGAFRLAIAAGAPVAPLAIRNGRAVSRRGDWRMRPGVEEVVFADPIPTDGLRAADAASLAERCRDVVIDLLRTR